VGSRDVSRAVRNRDAFGEGSRAPRLQRVEYSRQQQPRFLEWDLEERWSWWWRGRVGKRPRVRERDVIGAWI